jgi:hypothetical protein
MSRYRRIVSPRAGPVNVRGTFTRLAGSGRTMGGMSLDTTSSRGGPSLARRALAPLPPLPQPAAMPTRRSASLRELALTATLLYVYVGARGTALALGAARTVMAR